MRPEIDEYCVEHSSKPSALAEELAEFTRKNVPMSQMLIGPQEASLLAALIRINAAKRVLEIGCYTGYSALAMAEALPDDGELVTLDINAETTKIAKDYWARSPHGRKIKLVLGPALESIPKLAGKFDLCFIDADKSGYPAYVDLVIPRLNEKGFIVLDNTLREGAVLEENPEDKGTKTIKELNEQLAKNSKFLVCLLPLRDGVSLVIPSH